MKIGGVCVYVDDVPPVLEFYHRAFGFKTRHFDEAVFGDPANQYGELETGGEIVAFATHALARALMPGDDSHSGGARPSSFEIAFLAADVPAAFERATEAGAAAVAEPKVMPWGWTVAYVRSVEGTLVALCAPPEGGENCAQPAAPPEE